MKIYTKREDGGLISEGLYIPNNNNYIYQQALEEVEQGLALIEPYVAPDTRPQEERQWRDAELAKADIELNKVQDGRGTGLVSDWRDYRNALRDWPEHESFPDSAFRPAFVNTDT